MKDVNLNTTTVGNTSGGGSKGQSQPNPRTGQHMMPKGKVDKYVAYSGTGGAKNGVVKGC
jgi:hypothetical protein